MIDSDPINIPEGDEGEVCVLVTSEPAGMLDVHLTVTLEPAGTAWGALHNNSGLKTRTNLFLHVCVIMTL